MRNSSKMQFGMRQSDGFATLTGSLLERKCKGPPIGGEGSGTESLSGGEACAARKASNVETYSGRERRFREVSPVIERRRSRPPRIKVSVRLESYRHDRLKAAALLQSRTHQDLMTAALDFYLDHLSIPEMPRKPIAL